MKEYISCSEADATPAIQDMVVQAAGDFRLEQKFHINNLRLYVAIQHNKALSYKQTRDALYRVRQRVAIAHAGLGWYRWEF